MLRAAEAREKSVRFRQSGPEFARQVVEAQPTVLTRVRQGSSPWPRFHRSPVWARLLRLDMGQHKHAPDEPVFVLRAKDVLAPAIVEQWADAAEASGSPADKVQKARGLAMTMRAWQELHGSKVPD